MLKENGASDKVKEILKRLAKSYLDAIQDATIPVEDNKDDERIKLIVEQVVKQVVKNS